MSNIGKFRICCSKGNRGNCILNPDRLEKRMVKCFAFLPKKIGHLTVWGKPYNEEQYFNRSYGYNSCSWITSQLMTIEEL